MSSTSARNGTTESRDGTARTRLIDNGLDSVCIVVTVALLVLALLRVEGSVRVVLASGFTLFAPGWAIVTNWVVLRRRTRFASSIVLSISLLTLLAIVSVWIHAWHPVGLMECEAVVVIVAVGIGNVRRAFSTPIAAVRDDGLRSARQ